MKQPIIYLLTCLALLTSCNSVLDKPFSASTYQDDLKFFVENGIEQEEITLIDLYMDAVAGDTLILSGKTYSDMVDEGSILRDSIVVVRKESYIQLTDDVDIAAKIALIDDILRLDPSNSFANDEFPALDKQRKQEIVELKSSYGEATETALQTQMAERILELDRRDSTFNKNLVGLYTKKRKYKEARALLQAIETDGILRDEIHLNLSERVLIQQNVNSLIKLSHGKPKEVVKNMSIWEELNASSPGWKKATKKVSGYVTNTSSTLTADVQVVVTYYTQTTATIWFMSRTTNHKDYRKVVLKGIAPGESRSFTTSITIDDLGGYESFGTDSRITGTRVKTVLLSPKF